MPIVQRNSLRKFIGEIPYNAHMVEKNTIKKASQEAAIESFAVSFFNLFQVIKITTKIFDLFKVAKILRSSHPKKQSSKEQPYQIDITSTLY